MASDTKALAHNTMIQIAGKAAGMFLGIATVSVMLHYFGKVGYGEFTTAITFLSLFAVVVDFGLTLTTVQMISEPGADEGKILGNMLSLRLLTCLIVFIAAPIIGLAFPYPAIIKLAIAFGAISYFFSTVGQMLVGIYQKRLQMMGVVISETIGRTILFVGIVLVATWHGNLIDAVIVLVTANVIQALILLVLAKRFVAFRSRIDLNVWKEIIRRSWPIGVSIFFNLIYLRGDILILSLMKSQADVGVYGSAYKVIDVVSVLPVMFMGLALPLLVAAWKRNDHEAFASTIQKTFDFFMMIAIPIAVGAFALASPIMVLIGGKDFADAGAVLMILAPAAAVVFFGSLFGHVVVAVQKQRLMTIGYAVTAAVSVVAYFLLIPPFGTIGAAWVTLLSESMVAIVTFIVVQRTSHIKIKLMTSAKVFVSSGLMFLFLEHTVALTVIPQIILGSLVYFVALMALGGLKPHMIRSLFTK